MAAPGPQESNTGRAVGVGAGLGIVFGVVMFALNQDPVWIVLGLVFGAALGAIVGTLQAKRR